MCLLCKHLAIFTQNPGEGSLPSILNANKQILICYVPLQILSDTNFLNAAFLKLFKFREIGMHVSPVTMSHPSPRTVAPPPCLPLVIKDPLKEDLRFFHGILIG
jgi:hypothetical protein